MVSGQSMSDRKTDEVHVEMTREASLMLTPIN